MSVPCCVLACDAGALCRRTPDRQIVAGTRNFRASWSDIDSAERARIAGVACYRRQTGRRVEGQSFSHLCDDPQWTAEKSGARSLAEEAIVHRRQALKLFAGLAACPLYARTSVAEEAHHWSYEGASGPDKWGSLDAANGMCSRVSC